MELTISYVEGGQEGTLPLRLSVEDETSEIKRAVNTASSSTVISKSGNRKEARSGETMLVNFC
jgi:hypothetical protein